MYLVFTLVALFFAFYLELLTGSWYVFLPLVGNLVLYFTVASSWRQGLLVAILGGMCLDLLYGRSGFFTAMALIAVVPFAYSWDKAKLNAPLVFNSLFGAILPLFIFLIMGLLQWLSGAEASLEFSHYNWSLIIFAGALNSAVILLMIILLDVVAERLELECFGEREQRRKDRTDEEYE